MRLKQIKFIKNAESRKTRAVTLSNVAERDSFSKPRPAFFSVLVTSRYGCAVFKRWHITLLLSVEVCKTRFCPTTPLSSDLTPALNEELPVTLKAFNLVPENQEQRNQFASHYGGFEIIYKSAKIPHG